MKSYIIIVTSLASSKCCPEVTHHLFLWPQKALGRPVIIRTAPSTPNAGSSFVLSTIAVGVGVGLVVGVIVKVCVIVAFTTVGTTVVIGTFWFPERLTVVVVIELVVLTTVTLSEIDGVAVEFAED